MPGSNRCCIAATSRRKYIVIIIPTFFSQGKKLFSCARPGLPLWKQKGRAHMVDTA